LKEFKRAAVKDQVVALLQAGAAAAHAGNRAEARRDFRAALRLDSANVPALLWLAWLSDDPRASLAYVACVLENDPHNLHAHAALRWARRRVTITEPQELPSAPVPSASRFGETRNPILSIGVAARPGFWVALSLLIILIGATLAWTMPKEGPALAALAPPPTCTSTPISMPASTSTPPPTRTPTSTSTPTPPPLPTGTSTPAPTPTLSSTLTPSQTPTPSPSPVLPTAPPLPPSLTPAPLSIPSGEIRWIDIDLTHQQLAAYEGQTLVRITAVSTGLPRTPTPVGQYHIQIKLRYDDMTGPDYYLVNVPYVMYFYGGYGVHGTYWHANFGHPMSHGCVNLPTAEAEWLFHWADVGTMVNIHY